MDGIAVLPAALCPLCCNVSISDHLTNEYMEISRKCLTIAFYIHVCVQWPKYMQILDLNKVNLMFYVTIVPQVQILL
jgi:hypothetical protein